MTVPSNICFIIVWTADCSQISHLFIILAYTDTSHFVVVYLEVFCSVKILFPTLVSGVNEVTAYSMRLDYMLFEAGILGNCVRNHIWQWSTLLVISGFTALHSSTDVHHKGEHLLSCYLKIKWRPGLLPPKMSLRISYKMMNST